MEYNAHDSVLGNLKKTSLFWCVHSSLYWQNNKKQPQNMLKTHRVFTQLFFCFNIIIFETGYTFIIPIAALIMETSFKIGNICQHISTQLQSEHQLKTPVWLHWTFTTSTANIQYGFSLCTQLRAKNILTTFLAPGYGSCQPRAKKACTLDLLGLPWSRVSPEFLGLSPENQG